MLKRWNMTLIIGSFLLSIFGTFITRSGVIASVHSFTQSNVGYFFLAFLLAAGILSYTLLYTRWDRLEADVQLESMVSREAAFLFNNLLLVGIAFSVLWGTLFPILSEAVRGTKISVGPPFFNKVNVPLGLLLLGLTGIGPLIAWRKASIRNLQRQFVVPLSFGLVTLAALLAVGMRDPYPLIGFALAGFVTGTLGQEFVRGTSARHVMYQESYPVALARLVSRNRRRYGGYIVHLGALLYFVAFAGYAFRTEMEATLRPGDTASLRSPFGHTYTFTHVGVSQFEQLNRVVSQASVQVAKDGRPVGVMSSEKRQHFSEPTPGLRQKSFEPSTEVGIRTTLQEDLYIVYAGSVEGTEEAVYRFTINPLVVWVWIGGLVLVAGGLIAMWPGGAAGGTVRRGQAGYEVRLAGTASGVGA
jgi:cytochrome c-type biogenesis protein CcmF